MEEDVFEKIWALHNALRRLGKDSGLQAIHVDREVGMALISSLAAREIQIQPTTEVLPGEHLPFKEIIYMGIKIRWPASITAHRDGSVSYE